MSNGKVGEVSDIVEAIKPLLADRDPSIQGAVLADLLAIWLAGHAPTLRKPVLAMHLMALRGLVPVNEKILFGEAGHPARHIAVHDDGEEIKF